MPTAKPHPTRRSERPLAIVAGGASEAGRAISRQLAGEGFDFLFGAGDLSSLPAGELESLGSKVRHLPVDLADEEQVLSLYRAAEEEGRFVDALVLDVVPAESDDHEEDDEAALGLLRATIVAPLLLARLALPPMAERGRGQVFFTSPERSGLGGLAALYGASLAFLRSFADALAGDLAGCGVHVTAHLPG